MMQHDRGDAGFFRIANHTAYPRELSTLLRFERSQTARQQNFSRTCPESLPGFLP